ASRNAPRVAPLQCGPAQYVTNKVSDGYCASFDATILPCGRFTAPGTWPRANNAGPRTSSNTNPGVPLAKASETSQQSVSNCSAALKCTRAVTLSAAGTLVTALIASVVCMVLFLLGVSNEPRFWSRTTLRHEWRNCQCSVISRHE